MRADAMAPRTWLLAAVAGWAVLVWLLALFGLGGRIAPLPVDPARLANLPQLPPVATSRIGPPEQYVQVAARPLFDPGRRPRPFFIENQGTATPGQGFDFSLSSVLITPKLRMVILQPTETGKGEALRVKLGEEIEGLPGWRLAEVQPRSAVFDGPGGRRTLELQVYTGGGQAPTPRSSADLATAAKPVAAPKAPPVSAAAAAAAMQALQASPTAAMAALRDALGEVDPAAAPERQLQQVRERIEARRAQLRQQQGADAAASDTPSSPP